MPEIAVSGIARGLPDVLGRAVRDDVSWRVETACAPLLLNEDGTIPLLEVGEACRAERGWDLVVLITDLPRRAVTQPVLADFSTAERIAMVSLPALGGGLRLKARLRALLVHLIWHLAGNRHGLGPAPDHHTA